MTLSATNNAAALEYVLSTNNGSTSIDGSTLTAPANAFAFDVCTGWGGYTSNAVEVKGNSAITGNVEISFYGEGRAPTLTLTSGTLSGSIVVDEAHRGAKVTVTKYSAFDVAAPEGYKWDNSGKLTKNDYVAQIGETKYETLAEAFAAVTDSTATTIVLLNNCSGSGIVVPSERYITVDFGGYTYTVNSEPLAGSNGTVNQCFQLLKDSKAAEKVLN